LKKSQKVKSQMKKQNEARKTKYNRIYDDTRPTASRQQEAIENIPEHCWWLKQYLRGVYFTRGAK